MRRARFAGFWLGTLGLLGCPEADTQPAFLTLNATDPAQCATYCLETLTVTLNGDTAPLASAVCGEPLQLEGLPYDTPIVLTLAGLDAAGEVRALATSDSVVVSAGEVDSVDFTLVPTRVPRIDSVAVTDDTAIISGESLGEPAAVTLNGNPLTVTSRAPDGSQLEATLGGATSGTLLVSGCGSSSTPFALTVDVTPPPELKLVSTVIDVPCSGRLVAGEPSTRTNGMLLGLDCGADPNDCSDGAWVGDLGTGTSCTPTVWDTPTGCLVDMSRGPIEVRTHVALAEPRGLPYDHEINPGLFAEEVPLPATEDGTIRHIQANLTGIAVIMDNGTAYNWLADGNQTVVPQETTSLVGLDFEGSGFAFRDTTDNLIKIQFYTGFTGGSRMTLEGCDALDAFTAVSTSDLTGSVTWLRVTRGFAICTTAEGSRLYSADDTGAAPEVSSTLLAGAPKAVTHHHASLLVWVWDHSTGLLTAIDRESLEAVGSIALGVGYADGDVVPLAGSAAVAVGGPNPGQVTIVSPEAAPRCQ